MPAGLLAAPAPEKRDYRRSLNLSSNELDHPELGAFFAHFLRRWDGVADVGRYPYHPASTARIAALSGAQVDGVVLAPGSDDAIRMLMCTVATASGRLVLQVPNYSGYARYARAADVELQPVAVFGRSPDDRLEQLCDAVEPRCCVAVSDPDPIEGRLLGVERLGRLAEACDDRDAVLVVDGAYAAFAGVDHLELSRGRPNVVVVRTFSKSHGLAGMRAAAVFGHRDLVAGLARWQSFNAISSLTLDLMVHCLAERGFWERVHADVRRWRAALAARLNGRSSGWTVAPSRANFLLVSTPSEREAAAAGDALAARDVLVKRFDHDALALRRCLRMSVPGPDAMRRLLKALPA